MADAALRLREEDGSNLVSPLRGLLYASIPRR